MDAWGKCLLVGLYWSEIVDMSAIRGVNLTILHHRVVKLLVQNLMLRVTLLIHPRVHSTLDPIHINLVNQFASSCRLTCLVYYFLQRRSTTVARPHTTGFGVVFLLPSGFL